MITNPSVAMVAANPSANPSDASAVCHSSGIPCSFSPTRIVHRVREERPFALAGATLLVYSLFESPKIE